MNLSAEILYLQPDDFAFARLSILRQHGVGQRTCTLEPHNLCGNPTPTIDWLVVWPWTSHLHLLFFISPISSFRYYCVTKDPPTSQPEDICPLPQFPWGRNLGGVYLDFSGSGSFLRVQWRQWPGLQSRRLDGGWRIQFPHCWQKASVTHYVGFFIRLLAYVCMTWQLAPPPPRLSDPRGSKEKVQCLLWYFCHILLIRSESLSQWEGN